MSKIYRWGIVGAGGIANKFADAISHVENAKLQAVASTNAQRAKDFAQKYSIPNCYDSYEQLFLDDTVDVVYVATIHNFHCKNTIDALNANCILHNGLFIDEYEPLFVNTKGEKVENKCGQHDSMMVIFRK